MRYSSNEHIKHRTMKENMFKYLINIIGDKLTQYDSERYIKRGKDSWQKIDLYFETDTSVILVEVKTSNNRQGLLQLLHASRNIKTNKNIVLILACNKIGKYELRNFVESSEEDELKLFRCIVFDEEYNISKIINNFKNYKNSLQQSLLDLENTWYSNIIEN